MTSPSLKPHQPFFLDMPNIILLLFSVLTVAQCFYMFGGEGIYDWMSRSFALANREATLKYHLQPRPLGSLTPLFGHVLLHGGWAHFGMNFFFGLAFSVPVLRALGDNKKGNTLFLLLFLGSTLGGALLFLAVNQGVPKVAIGASSALSGLFAATAWASGGQKRVVQWGIIWIALNMIPLVFGRFLEAHIAWSAHIGGYLAGACLYPLFIRLR